MFSYRHGFHAGNHADVLKHTILSLVLDYYRSKDSPFWGIDTHAGAGLYDLGGSWANTRSEYVDGVGKIWNKATKESSGESASLSTLTPEEQSTKVTDSASAQGSVEPVPEALHAWLASLRRLNPDGQLRYYPGSPWVWLDSWRSQDKLKLIEQLPAEADVLRKNLQQLRDLPARSVQVLEQDGFESLKAFLPPATRRAIVLVDPSYEDKRDYHRVIEMLRDAITRFPTGCYMVWYPRVSRLQVDQMRKQLRKVSPDQWIDIEMTVSRPPADGHGLFGSGCFLINPPYTLHTQMKQAMPWLAKTLALDSTARWSIDAGDAKSAANARTAPQHPNSPRSLRAPSNYRRSGK